MVRTAPEQREAGLSRRRLRDREWARQRLATERAEEREARLARSRVRARATRAAESEETQQARLRSYQTRRIAVETVIVCSLPLAKHAIHSPTSWGAEFSV